MHTGQGSWYNFHMTTTRWVNDNQPGRQRTEDGRWLAVRQNAATCGLQWKLYRIVRGERVGRGSYGSLAAAKAAAEARGV